MKDSVTYQKVHSPFYTVFPNVLELLLNRWDKTLVDLSENRLLEAAQKKTGLTDFGSDDFHEPLSVLIKSCKEDARLTFAGKVYTRIMLVKALVNRLKIENDIKNDPGILQRPVKKPLIIIGLPRTGTTLLHNLLAQDPKSRFLRCWEAMEPSPPPTPETENKDKRIFNAKLILGIKRVLNSEITTVKPIKATSPEECIILLGQSFLSHRAFSIFLENKQYLEWLKQQDLTPAYRYYYKILQVLQRHYSTSHWVLKAPEHLINIEPLLTVFPDACLIQTHRDLTFTVPSSSSMLAVFRATYSNHVDLKDIGSATFEWMVEAVENAMAVRQKFDSKRFCDIQYKDLTQDPIGTVHKIYDYFGYSGSEEMDKRMQAWLKDHPRHKNGVHRYSLSQFSLDAGEIQRRFSPYYQAYQIPIEKTAYDDLEN